MEGSTAEVVYASRTTAPVVTVVVATYNVGGYLHDCLASVLRQTIVDSIALVVVDDGSTDASLQVVMDYAPRFPNVTVVHQENRGPGAARNAAIALCETEYITFLDSDDILPRRALEYLVAAMETHDADLAIGNMERFPRSGRFRWSKYFERLKGKSRVTSLARDPELIVGASACNKMFLASRVKALDVRFGETRLFDDVYFTVPYMMSAQRIALIPNTVYRYRYRSEKGSVMDNIYESADNFLEAAGSAEHLIAQLDRFPDSQRLLSKFLAQHLAGHVTRAHEYLDEETARELFGRLVPIIEHVDPRDVAAYWPRLPQRRAFAALAAHSFEMFYRPESSSRGIEIIGGRVCYRGAADVPDAWRSILHIAKPPGYLEYVRQDRARRELVFGGVVTADFCLPPDMGGAEIEVHLTRPGFERRLAVRRHPRSEQPPQLGAQAWEAAIDCKALPSGRYRVSLRLSSAGDGGGPVGVPLTVTAGLLRSARLRSVGGTCWQVVPRVGSNGAVQGDLRLARGIAARARMVLWQLRTTWSSPGRGAPFRKHAVVAAAARLFPLPRIWLIGERPDTAQDNGFELFKFLSGGRHGVVPVYVAAAHSDAFARASRYGRVVAHGGRRHKIATLLAEALVSSRDIDAYLMPAGWSGPAARQHLFPYLRGCRVFLQHGVILNGIGPAVRRGNLGLDLFLCSAEQEERYLRATARGYGDTEIVRTGLARFDELLRPGGAGVAGRPADRETDLPERFVLVAPTWRYYLTTPSYVAGKERMPDPSAFTEFWTSFLAHDGLRDALAAAGVELVFLAHYEFGDWQPAPGIVRAGQSQIPELLARCQLLVTDYSSLQVDVALRGKPVVYTDFDDEAFFSGHYPRGWFSARSEGFGPCVTTPQELVDQVVRYVSADFAREAVFDARVRTLDISVDGRNRTRIVEAVKAAVDGGRA